MNDKPTFALSYDTLQEIHTLTGMVCGWRMSLPTKMIKQAQKVHWLMIGLHHVPNSPTNLELPAPCGDRVAPAQGASGSVASQGASKSDAL